MKEYTYKVETNYQLEKLNHTPINEYRLIQLLPNEKTEGFKQTYTAIFEREIINKIVYVVNE